MGSVYLMNTTTLEVTHFFISRNSSRKSQNVYRLLPGSYRVIRSQMANPAKFQFVGVFSVLQNNESVFTTTVNLRDVIYFSQVYPNYLVVGAGAPHEGQVYVKLEPLIPNDF